MATMSCRSRLPHLLVSLMLGVLTALIAADGASALALPGPGSAKRLSKRDVWSPEITSPSDRTVWRVGETVQVTW